MLLRCYFKMEIINALKNNCIQHQREVKWPSKANFPKLNENFIIKTLFRVNLKNTLKSDL